LEAGPELGTQSQLGSVSVRANIKAGTEKYINSRIQL